MIFASDNWAGASETILSAAVLAAQRGGPAYGDDPHTGALQRRFTEVFEREVAVFLVGSGTAANSLALSAYARPGGIVFTHEHAHVLQNEAGATEFFGGGARVVGLAGSSGKITPEALDTAIRRYSSGNVHHGIPFAVSLTQANELGIVYPLAEISSVAAVAHRHELIVHLDGARFAGAIASLGCTPAEASWRAGVDVMSFGGTKNGCLLAEAVIFFDPTHAADFGFRRQRAGHGFSKNWFIAAQFEAYLEGGHWLDLARLANQRARRLADAIRGSSQARLAATPDTNLVFAILAKPLHERLRAAGAVYHLWPPATLPTADQPTEQEVLARLVTSFQTTDEEIDRFAKLLASALAPRGQKVIANRSSFPKPQNTTEKLGTEKSSG